MSLRTHTFPDIAILNMVCTGTCSRFCSTMRTCVDNDVQSVLHESYSRPAEANLLRLEFDVIMQDARVP